MVTTELAAIAIVIVAGLVRGTTGFGGAMLMTPVLSVLYPPVNAVVIALLLETAAALVMFPDAVAKSTVAYVVVPHITGGRDSTYRRLLVADPRPRSSPGR